MNVVIDPAQFAILKDILLSGFCVLFALLGIIFGGLFDF